MKLDDLIDETLAIIKTHGYAESTWKHAFRNGRCSSIRQFFAECGQEDFCMEVMGDYIIDIQKRYEQGGFSRSRYTHLKKMAARLSEVYETGELHWKLQSNRTMALNPYFKAILNAYVDFMKDILSATSVQVQKSVILHFLEFLYSEKHYNDFSELSLKDVQDFVLFKRQMGKTRIDTVTHATKRFVSYLREAAIIDEDLTPALHMQAQRVARILKRFTHEEVERLLAQPDRNTPIGKRNYAIMLLGKNTGLRIGDIINLKFSDIDWHSSELTIIQNKTGKQLVLPLEPGTESAIKDYMNNGRPVCALPFIFLRSIAPYNALSQQAVTVFFTRYRENAGIQTVPFDGKSFHGLRRSIASWMLESDISLTTISQVLGHNALNSAVHYLPFDEKRLRLCGFSLNGIEVAREGLM